MGVRSDSGSGSGSGAATHPHAQRIVAVVTAGTRMPSSTAKLAERLADAAVAELAARGIAASIVTVDLRYYAADLAEAVVGETTSSNLVDAIASVTAADGLIAVTPTFASSYAGLFKSFFDVLHPESLVSMPTVLGATGGSVRHSLVIEYALRPLLNYFHALIVPTGVFAAAEDADPAAAERLTARIRRAASELADLVETAPGRRVTADDPAVFTDPTRIRPAAHTAAEGRA